MAEQCVVVLAFQAPPPPTVCVGRYLSLLLLELDIDCPLGNEPTTAALITILRIRVLIECRT